MYKQYRTNLPHIEYVELFENVNQGNILSLSQRSDCGYVYSVLFSVLRIDEENLYIELIPFVPKYGRIQLNLIN